MGLNTLSSRSAGDTITADFFNDFYTALNADFIGRNSSGVPATGQNLGTVAIPWGTINADNLVIGGQTFDPALATKPANVVNSGKVRATSNQPAFITPNGAALSLIVAGLSTSLVYDVNGTAVTLSADLTKSGLTAAPSSNNTCLVNDTTASGQESTRTWGEEGGDQDIVVDTMGSNITALVGKFAAFKIGTEYFTAFVESTTKLSRCFRGYFYDSSLNPKNRVTFSNNDTITLMKQGWLFIENNATTLDVTYNPPTWSFTSPGSPATGDYWYDLANSLWKRYDGAAFQIINRTYIGTFCSDSMNTVAARCVDFYKRYTAENTLELEYSTTEIVRSRFQKSSVNVAGTAFRFEDSLPNWNITTDLATSADMYNGSEQSSTVYYAYLADTGETILSDISPYLRDDLYGKYHPHNPWRCLGQVTNGSGSDFSQSTVITESKTSRGPEFYKGYFDLSGSPVWSTSSSSFADPSLGSGSISLVSRLSQNMYVYAAASSKCGIRFVPSIGGTYRVRAIINAGITSGSGDFFSARLYDGTNELDIIQGSSFFGSTAVHQTWPLEGFLVAPAGVETSVYIQLAISGTQTSIEKGLKNHPVEWLIERVV